MEGNKVIEDGAYWRVGDGQRIDVWKDAWIKQLPSFKVIQPEGTVPTPIKVAALIDQERREWNSNILKEIFKEEEVDVITRIRLRQYFRIS